MQKPDMPKRLVLELTNKCNLRCAMCAQSYYDFKYSNMSMDVFYKILPVISHMEEVTLFGWGETLLHSHFHEIFETIIRNGGDDLRTYIVTNGLLLDRHAEMLVKNRLTYLSISFDGASETTYHKIRKGSNYHKILSNLKEIVSLKSKYSTDAPYMRFIFVAQKSNIEELPLLIQMAADLGLKEVKVVYVTIYHHELIEKSLWFHQGLTKQVFDDARSVSKELGVCLSLPPLIGQDPAGLLSHRDCEIPWTDLFIGSNGIVRPCIISTEALGDLNHQTVDEIWYGDAFKEFRLRVNSDSPSSECARCNQNRHLNVNCYDAHVRVEANVPAALRK